MLTKRQFSIIQFLGLDTQSGQACKKYRPLFLDHFDKKEAEVKVCIIVFIVKCIGVQCFNICQVLTDNCQI